jgi:HEAT repeat protein
MSESQSFDADESSDPKSESPLISQEYEEARALVLTAATRELSNDEVLRLIQLSASHSWDVRVKAATGLWYIQHPEYRSLVISTLVSLLGDTHRTVRISAVVGLAKLRAKEAVPALMPLLADPHPQQQEAVRKVLRYFGYQFHQEEDCKD